MLLSGSGNFWKLFRENYWSKQNLSRLQQMENFIEVGILLYKD